MFNSFALGNSFDFTKLKESEKEIRTIENNIINNWVVKEENDDFERLEPINKPVRNSILMSKILQGSMALDRSYRKMDKSAKDSSSIFYQDQSFKTNSFITNQISEYKKEIS